MKLSTLLNTADYITVKGTADKEIEKLVYHSDKVSAKSLFFAVPGNHADGKEYVREAISKGASAIVLTGAEPEIEREEVTIILVPDVRKTMAQMAATFYGNPSKDLLMIGVTGTKGKTSTTTMICQIMEEAGISTGIIGTIANGWQGHMEEASHTTPEAIDNQALLRKMADAGCKACVMEVSSQGLKYKRVDGIDFDIGVFTNLSPDHIGIGEHQDYDDYRFWKSRLFRKCKRAIINIDHREWPQMVAGASLERVLFYGRNEEADFRIGSHRLWNEKGTLGVEYLMTSRGPCGDGKTRSISLAMPGEFNIYNSAAAIAVTRALGIPWSIIEESLSKVKVPGRVELVPYSDDFTVMVDYAHNGMALESLLKSLRQYEPERLILVFGCGGNRDRNRRFEMAKAASENADLIIITSDNPRDETPEQIIMDIESHVIGKAEVMTIPGRREAIVRALQEGRKGDIIIVTGKGHETYQIIGDKKYHFDDREEIFKARGRNTL